MTTLMRRGLPRTAGGQPWPPVEVDQDPSAPEAVTVTQAPTVPQPSTITRTAVAVLSRTQAGPLRRGLPRVAGGEAWPPEVEVSAIDMPAPEPVVESQPLAAVRMVEDRPPTVEPEAGPDKHQRPRGRAARWMKAVGGAVIAVAVVVLIAKGLMALPAVQGFVIRYPGEYALPAGAPVGLPGWLGWQHFFNAFLMVLIIRSGLQVRRERKPAAYWSPRWNPARKISLTLWFHQSLDVLWLLNGAFYVVLLFVTGQWVRIVPTSWEVFPNAVSAALQYASLDWPTEHGWVNYNSLQQLAYFVTVFIAVPVAMLSGVRMSGIWPARAVRLSRALPVEVARAVHFPTMAYFVAFIVAHVALVFSTGARRNLNHMFASQDAVSWVGFGIFVLAVAVTGAAWVAARPVILAPLAGLLGRVSNR